jgi:2,3-dihydroxy-p-cumate/2,3-dihydroxybenzoate 3,4-dioxygenase
MLEVESLDDVMRSYHFLRLRKAPIGMGPGRHPNCQTVHVYVQTPGGFAVEFGWGHRRLDDAAHQPIVYPSGTPVDVWGGDVQSSEFELGSLAPVLRGKTAEVKRRCVLCLAFAN